MQGFLCGTWLIANYFHSFLKFTTDRPSTNLFESYKLGYNFTSALVIKINYYVSEDLAKMVF